jgi:Ca-activated chloride channel family protein
VIYPREGIITADYPLMLLNGAKRADYEKLVTYLRTKDFQTRLSALTLRRPINPEATMAAAIPRRTLVELPFPGDPALVSALLDTFLSDVRIPGSSRYVLDLSGSMEGDRIASLKRAMLMLAAQNPHGSERYARFLNREEVGIITFSSQPAPTVLFPMGSDAATNLKERAAVTRFIEPLHVEESTAIYSSVKQALTELAQERNSEHDKRYYTVVLMTDGENNRGLSHSEFNDWYKTQGGKISGIPVFPILFGEGNERELQELAELTGGKMFDSRTLDLPVVFKDIRGYQ